MISIASNGLSADIDPLGAQLVALRDADGRDLQWDGDPAVWKGRAPILFPIVGALAHNQYRLDGQVYALPRHGFARNALFTPLEAAPSRARFQLQADAQTLAAYPFHFALEMDFAIEARTLHIVATIRNLEGDKTLPASFGFHPALRWPLPYDQPRAAHFLQFECDEPAPVRRLDLDGLLRRGNFPTPIMGNKLVLRDDLFLDDAMILDRIESRSLTYGAASGPRIRIDFPDTTMLGLWTKPGADFICIEPWHGHADPEGFNGDFRDKPGVFLLPPGQARECRMSISLCPE